MDAAVADAPLPQVSRRPEKELLVATKAFTPESRARGWLYTLSTLAILVALTLGSVFSPWWPLRLAFAVVQGLVVVRMFILYHDFFHGAILRQSRAAHALYSLFGYTVLVPPSVWKETHNYHHAHTAKIVGSHIGSFPVVTTAMWKTMTPAQRALYRAARHPLNMVLAVLTVFFLGMVVRPLVRAPAKHWGAGVTLVVTVALAVAAFASGHVDWWVFGWLIPMWVACMAGAYLFYAQHNFPEGYIADRQRWTFSGAALDSSSYFVMNPVMHWFTGNIGYHHVHHLNAAIPFYRLKEAMDAVPELQQPGTTTWSVKDIRACFANNLWDPEQEKMVPYPRTAAA